MQRDLDTMKRMLAFMVAKGCQWVKAQRSKLRPGARALSSAETRAFEPFFEAGVLACVRVALVPLIDDPPFYADLHRLVGVLGICGRPVQ
ncbi:MAG: hypothetical protein KAX44_09175, partial [Candidatus Brocadiae bacterium]|nr:hypothetical protein [Candidatus Brocadiia bacterium]